MIGEVDDEVFSRHGGIMQGERHVIALGKPQLLLTGRWVTDRGRKLLSVRIAPANAAFQCPLVFTKCPVKWCDRVTEAPVWFLLFPVKHIHPAQCLDLTYPPEIHLRRLQILMPEYHF